MKEKLKNQLLDWDGTHIDYLKNIYLDYINEPSFFQNIITLCVEVPDLQTSTTWLIKHHFDEKNKVEATILEPILISSKHFQAWEAQLHLLQILPHISMNENVVPHVEEFVRKCLKSKVKFVRAWAYQGLFEVSKYIPELKEEVQFLCEQALEIESASVKARIRKIVKKL